MTKEKLKQFFGFFHSLDVSWQIYSILAIYALITIVAFFMKWQIGLMLLLLLFVIILFLVVNMNHFFREINTVANKLSRTAKVAQEDSLYRSPIAVLLYDNNQRVKWMNPAMQHIFGSKDVLGESLITIDKEFEALLQLDTQQEWQTVSFLERYYKFVHQADNKVMYLLDTTEEQNILKQKKYDQIVFGYLFLDDYDELVQSMDDQQSAKFDSDLLNDLNSWAKTYHIYLKRLEEEKFLLILNQLVLDQLEKEKFQSFEQIQEKNYLKNIPISMSLGIAYSHETNYQIDALGKQAQLNLDLALGRGGEQIVVRSHEGKARFYGGKTNPTEKRTNVRAKLVFQALLNSIEQADFVLVAGHKYPDMDSISSAIGIYKIVKQYGKACKVIVNQDEFNQDIRHLLDMPQIKHEAAAVFVDKVAAEQLLTPNTLVIMVDHHKPSLSEAEDFIEGNDVVIIDHHRRSEEFPKTSVLTYIEPSASSASELITEFFMNMRTSMEALNKFEATALLAGIIVDTNNFALRTGSRTFDAASYLKSRGADTAQIKRMLKEDIERVKLRNQLIQGIQFLDQGYAVVKAADDLILDNVAAAQTADQMLDLNDVDASFVIYRRSESVIGISARSFGTINVQLIMERLGGGGHLSNAAAQLSEVTVDEGYQQLLAILDIKTKEDE